MKDVVCDGDVACEGDVARGGDLHSWAMLCVKATLQVKAKFACEGDEEAMLRCFRLVKGVGKMTPRYSSALSCQGGTACVPGTACVSVGEPRAPSPPAGLLPPQLSTRTTRPVATSGAAASST